MKEYAFTKWLVSTLQADGTERDMVYNEQMGIFTVRGENQFQKGSIDTQHTGVFARIKRRNQHPDQRQADRHSCPFLHRVYRPHQWSDLKTNRDFEGCLLITRRENFFAGSRMHPFQSGSLCIQTRIGAVYSIGETGSSPDTITCGHATPHPSAKKRIISCLKCWENTLRSLILEVWNIILRMYKQENEFEHSFRWKDTLPRFLYLMHTNCRYHHTVKWYADQLYVSPRCVIGQVKETLWQDSQPAHQRKPDRRSKSLSAQSGQQRAGRGRKALFL